MQRRFTGASPGHPRRSSTVHLGILDSPGETLAWSEEVPGRPGRGRSDSIPPPRVTGTASTQAHSYRNPALHPAGGLAHSSSGAPGTDGTHRSSLHPPLSTGRCGPRKDRSTHTPQGVFREHGSTSGHPLRLGKVSESAGAATQASPKPASFRTRTRTRTQSSPWANPDS